MKREFVHELFCPARTRGPDKRVSPTTELWQEFNRRALMEQQSGKTLWGSLIPVVRSHQPTLSHSLATDRASVRTFHGFGYPLTVNLSLELPMITTDEKAVFVRKYVRIRFGRFEDVCEHYRSYPNQ